MKKFRKYLVSALALILVAVISITGTIAYLTDTETAVNVMILGEINIEQYEQDRDGNDFIQGQTMLPLVGSAANKDANGYPTASNYIDKIVTVKNTGKNAAYVRTFIAIPDYSYEGQTGGDASLNVIHWNGYSKGDAAPAYPAATRIPGTQTDVANDWSWGKDANASVWPGNHGDWNVVKDVEINGQVYNIYVVTHVSAVQPGAITAPSMIGVYLDSKVDYDHAAGVYTYEGKVIEGFDGTVKVLVGTQAVQYDDGWGDAWTALDTAFGTPDVGHPWVDGVELPTLVATAEELQDALNNAQAGKANVIVLTDDIVGDIVVTQKANTKITIEGQGNEFAGVLVVDGKSATLMSAGITINNVNFKADSISADACIRLGDGTNATRYTCNVTVNGCTFDVPGAVGIKSYTGGDKNLIVTDCTATANAHSLIQAKGIDGILVENCTVASKNGLNFNNSTNVTVSACNVDVKGYAVRFGESSGGIGAAEVYLIKDCTLKSANEDGDAVIIIRGTADYSTLTIENTTLVGDPDITNTATDATVIR